MLEELALMQNSTFINVYRLRSFRDLTMHFVGDRKLSCLKISTKFTIIGHIFVLLQGQYTLDLLNSSSTLTDEIFMAYVDVIESFLKDVSPASVVDRLQTLLRNLNDTDLLTTNSNVEVR